MHITFDHLSLNAVNPEKMKDFLISLLGFTVGYRPNLSFDGYFLFSGDKDLVHIFKKTITNTVPLSIDQAIVHHISFATDSYDEVMQRISALNLPYSINTVPQSNRKQIFVQGPESLIIELQVTP